MKRAREEDNAVVSIDAGGTLFRTTRQTLLNSAGFFPHSTLAELLGAEPPNGGAGGAYFVDTDAKLFRHVLQLLRRPTLTSEAPPGVAPQAWAAELDYWGLSERLMGVEERAAQRQERAYNRNRRALQQLGDEVRAQIKDNEVEAVRAVLDKSGYSAACDKGRDTTLMLPVGHCPLACGADLGAYILANGPTVKALLTEVLAPCDVKIEKVPHRPKHPLKYRFAGADYSSEQTETLTVALRFGDI